MTEVRRPRVAVIVRRFGSHFGGLERYAESLVRNLANDFDFFVICQEWASPLPVPHVIVPRVRRLPSYLNLALFTWRCLRILKGVDEGLAGPVDLIHSHENIALGDLQSVHLMPVRFSRMGKDASWRRRLSTWLSPRLLTYLTLEALRYRPKARREIVAVSPLTLRQIDAAFERRPTATVIPPGVVCPDSKMSREEACRALGIDPERRYLILVAHEPVRKGLKALLAALPLLDPLVDLLVVGEVPQRRRAARDLAAETDEADRVHVWPTQRDLEVFYAAADICVFPTRGDAFGMVPLEAMAHGRPTVMSSRDFCGFAEFVRHESEALLLEHPEDAAAIADAVNALLRDRDLYDRLARNGLALAAAMDWRTTADEYSAIYRRLLTINAEGSLGAGTANAHMAGRWSLTEAGG